MQTKPGLRVSPQTTLLYTISCLLGVLFLAIGLVNAFWGNDSLFGVFIILLSIIYFVPSSALAGKLPGFLRSKVELIKIVIGLFIIWASLGVGELFDKIEMMRSTF